MQVFKRIRDLREDKDLSQAQVAKLLKVSQPAYSKYETGLRDIPINVVIQLSDYYEVSIDYLLGRTDEKSRYPRVKIGN